MALFSFIEMICSNFPRQLLSLKKNLNDVKFKTKEDQSDFLFENNHCSVYSVFMTACIINEYILHVIFDINSDCSLRRTFVLN